MNRAEIRDAIRTLGDELQVADQGLFSTVRLNTLINSAQRTLQLKLITVIPKEFRGTPVEFDYTVSKDPYNIVTDVGIAAAEFFMFENILHNKSGNRPSPLYYLEHPEDIWQYGNVAATGSDPGGWGYQNRENIFIRPIAGGTVANRLKAYWYKRLPDLNHDDDDTGVNVATPVMDATLHEIIPLEAMKTWCIRDRDGELKGWIEDRIQEILFDAGYALSMKQGFTTGRLPGAREYLGFNPVSANLIP